MHSIQKVLIIFKLHHRLQDVPMMRLTFSFRFGQMDMSLFKRKNMKGELKGTQGAMQGMQQ